MTSSWARGDRVRLKQDCAGAHNSFVRGQTGRLGAILGDRAVVEFDGYEAERAAAERFRLHHGEAPNVVPWADLLPLACFEPA